MSRSTTALFVGLILGFVAIWADDFGKFVIVVLFGAVGLLIGMILDGKIDIQALLGRAVERR